MSKPSRLLFVYNADSGLFSTLADIGHKILSPDTYDCRLCALTHGYFAERREWRTLIEGLGVECAFLHRDEYRQRYPGIDHPLPAIFRLSNGEPVVCLDADALESCADLGELQKRIRQHCLLDEQATTRSS